MPVGQEAEDRSGPLSVSVTAASRPSGPPAHRQHPPALVSHREGSRLCGLGGTGRGHSSSRPGVPSLRHAEGHPVAAWPQGS